MKKNIKSIILLLLVFFISNIEVTKIIPATSYYMSFREVSQISNRLLYQDIEFYSNKIYVATGTGISIIDVRDPKIPKEINFITVSEDTHRISIQNNLLFVAALWDGLYIYDISDPRNVSFVSHYNNNHYVYGVKPHGNLLFVPIFSEGLLVLDCTDPSNIHLVNHYDGGYKIGTIDIQGEIAYTSCGTAGIRILNISNVLNIYEIGIFPAKSHFQDVVENDNIVYTVDFNYGFYILDVSDPTNPTKLARERGMSYSVTVIDKITSKIAYIAGYENGLRVYNVTKPSKPKLMGTYYDGGYLHDVVVRGDYIYIADGYDGLEVLFYQYVLDKAHGIGYPFGIVSMICLTLIYLHKRRNKAKNT
ncbi:MAG: hypothetical protein FK733_10995 [Asgard group archaeon]|nr:hypothetical protein [Asgard group archaeon]